MAKCRVKGCGREAIALALCAMHRQRLLRTGRIGPAGKMVGRGSITPDGYRRLYRPGHPNASVNGGIFEHVETMSRLLGRPLRPNERVHHKNGHRSDNSPSNLELWATVQPSGQKVADKIKAAAMLLDDYAADVTVWPKSLEWLRLVVVAH